MAGRRAEDLDRDYEAAGFGGELGFGKRPALLIVDMVMAYLDPSSPLYAGVEAELEVIKSLRRAARTADTPIIFTNVEYAPGGADGGLFYKKVEALKCFDRGNPLGRFPEGLEPEEGELVITKQYPSAFFGTPLASILTSMGCDSVIVTGVTTSGCVRASALDALQHGFIPIVVRDACGERDEEVQKANLFDLAAKYADVLDAEAVLARLEDREA